MQILISFVPDTDSHKDLLFEIPGLVGVQHLDSYYFWISMDISGIEMELAQAVKSLLGSWLGQVRSLLPGQTVHLPIDFSDQYTGCLEVRRADANVILQYGHSLREGYSVNALNPEDYYANIRDFTALSEKAVTVPCAEFIQALEVTLAGL